MEEYRWQGTAGRDMRSRAFATADAGARVGHAAILFPVSASSRFWAEVGWPPERQPCRSAVTSDSHRGISNQSFTVGARFGRVKKGSGTAPPCLARSAL